MSLEERQLLVKFSRSAFDLLSLVVLNHEEWLPEELWENYRAALSDGEASLGDLERALLPEHFLPDEPNSPSVYSVEASLRNAGLAGASLDLKLHGHERAQRRFRASPSRRFLRPVFRWANVILGSLVAALGVGEALKELKETVEAGVDDQEDSER